MNNMMPMNCIFHSEVHGSYEMEMKNEVQFLTSDNAVNNSLSSLNSHRNPNKTYLEADSAMKINSGTDSNESKEDQIKFNSSNKETEFNLCTSNETCKRILKFIKKENKTVKIWECGICGKEFQHQYTLMRHFPTHTGERKFKCEECGKAFRQKSTLSQHRVIHSEARPYICGLCKKTFNRASTLKSHHVTHSDKKPHICPFCGKGFHQKGNLRNHIFVHTEERPYKCDTCKKGFNQMSNLMSHKKHSHGNANPYICNMCHKEFPRKYVLRAHEEYVHGIKYRGETFVHGVDKINRTGEVWSRDFKNRGFNQKDHKKTMMCTSQISEREMSLQTTVPPIIHGHQSVKIYEKHEYGKQSDSPSVIIDPVNTKAMFTAKRDGRIPIALLKTALESSVLVKVVDTKDMKQMLVPATAQDLKSAGTITTVKRYNASSDSSGKINAIQIKVPIVATVVQKPSVDGRSLIEVERPNSQQGENCFRKVDNIEKIYSKELQPPFKCMIEGSSYQCIQKYDVHDPSCDEKNSSVEIHACVAGGVSDQKGNEDVHQGEKHSEDFQIVKKKEIMNTWSYGNCETTVLKHDIDQFSPSDCNKTLTNISHLNNINDTVHTVGYDIIQNEEQYMVNNSQDKMLAECNSNADMQHTFYEPSDSETHNSDDVKGNLVINALRYVLNQTENMYIE